MNNPINTQFFPDIFLLGGGRRIIPDSVEDATPSTEYTSRSFWPDIVSGEPITVTGGTISIDGGAFGSTGFNWVVGSEVQLRGTSSADYSTLETEETVDVVMSVDGVATYTFTITNEIDPALLNASFPYTFPLVLG